MKVLVLSDGIPGHENQSIGIVEMAQKFLPKVTYAVHQVEFNYPVMRGIMYMLQSLLVRDLNIKNCNRIISQYKPIKDIEKVDVIITTGGRCAFLVAALAEKYQKKSIQNSSKAKMIPFRNTSYRIANVKDSCTNTITTIIPPNRYQVLPDKAKTGKSLFLVGGNGSNIKYRSNDLRLLVESIKELTMKNSTTPIIATSRRTGKGFEEVLKRSLGDLACKSSLWYHHQSGRRSLKSLMMEADIIYVTGDSAMMHAEAISTGLPVISILPATVKPEDKLEQQLKKYEREGFIQRRFFGECLDYETSKSSRLKVQEVQKLFAETLISKLME